MGDRHFFLAFDCGATSGRAMLGSLKGGRLEMEEVYRFPNTIASRGGRYYWDIDAIKAHFDEALSSLSRKGVRIDSIGVDTWGVDFALMDGERMLLQPRSYRDPYTRGVPDEVFRVIPRDELYGETGLQILDFNSIFQLYALKKEGAPLEKASGILFIPDLLVRHLCGKSVCEYTIASTSGLVNQKTRSFDRTLLDRLGIDGGILPEIVQSGTIAGYLDKRYGLGKVPVVSVAEHDTASAVVAVPSSNERFAYLSSGTWSLMGIETPSPIMTPRAMEENFTNEGGIEGTTRFLKNITGMWILEQCRERWKREGKDCSYDTLVQSAKASSYSSLIDPDDPSFASPSDMVSAIDSFILQKGESAPETVGDYARCIYCSLARRYREVLGKLDTFAPFEIDTLHIIGGGAANDYMSQLTSDAIGRKVISGPVEATAIGNILMQAGAAGLVTDRWQMRRIVADSFPVKTFTPSNGKESKQ